MTAWSPVILVTVAAVLSPCKGNFIIEPEDSTFVFGDVVILRCSINKTNLDSTLLYWSKDNHHLSVNDNLVESLDRGLKSRLSVVGNRSLGEYNLMISNVRKTDAGSYICSFIGLSGGQTSRAASLTVLIPPRKEFPLCFVMAQSLRSADQSEEFWPGQTARLRCVSVGGEPPAVLVWKRKNATISSTKTSESIHERVLTPSDNGVVFACEATSPALRTPRVCSVIPLNIKPKVQIRLMTREVIEGSNATYHCEASAIPSIHSITWSYDGLSVGFNDSKRIIISEDKQFLTIVDIKASEDQVTIQCDVSTPTGLTSSHRMKMLVTRKPPKPTDSPNSDVPPNVKNADRFPWNSELHVIVIMVAGSCVGVFIFIAAILICWGFARAKKPRRPNTRLQVDHIAPSSHELSLEPLTYPGQIVYNTLPDDTYSRKSNSMRSTFSDENSPGYLSSLYASIDRRGGYAPRFASLRSEEKPVAQITPTTSQRATSHKGIVIPYSQPLISYDKDSFKGSSMDSSSADETEID
ncbi:Kin of IRRE-like protein 1 [Holothuria leucospilota]|uniref:Kin of IRRE-like protein 1 n=1 Tax=Holothuria leucospilota TaxID=206669 RepID=A0A9Q1H1V4_HOLLE|nr:Kin of IRRE-like protein 1 [Holothuria leucospilota]